VARSTKSDLAVLLLTWAATILFDLVTAGEIGLAAAALFFIRRMADVHVIDHPEVPADAGLPAAIAHEIGVIDVDRPLFFGDAHRLEEIVLADRHRVLVMRLAVASTMDVTAALVLRDLHHELHARGVRLVLSDVAPPVLALLERVGIVENLGRENIFGHAEDAVASIGRELQARSTAA
jgi:SulP family sulfate permease